MGKLIELDAAIDVIEAGRLTKLIDAEIAINGLKALPFIDAAPVVHGWWINGKCNKCGGHAPFWVMATTYYPSKFCPHCGAKMDGNNHE